MVAVPSKRRRWQRAAERLPFSSRHSMPRKRTLSGLINNSSRNDGKEVTVEGVLGELDIRHSGPARVLSVAVIQDANGNTLKAVLPYIKLDSGGMVPGAAVRISGNWHHLSDKIDEPALHADRLSLSERARESWQDFATFELRRVYTPIPHGLAISFSWESGLEGPGNQLRFGIWYQ